MCMHKLDFESDRSQDIVWAFKLFGLSHKITHISQKC